VIHIFTGDRILYEGPIESPLTLVDAESSGNCGWGFRILNNPLYTASFARQTTSPAKAAKPVAFWYKAPSRKRLSVS
jgi:hypothetical protein